MVVNRKKLIEVALPLEAINVASAREKSIRHGHPSTLHLWWARRPLAAARAVIFSQMVDDPSGYVDTLLGEATTRRAAERELKKKLALWEKLTADFAAATGKETVAVPEPGPKPTLEDVAADIERERLFDIIRELVKWENTTNEVVLDRARAEIWQSWRRTCVDNVDHPRAKELFDRHKLPAFHDPFAGGGALPLEAQRLGLEAYATDLNPVAVLINKAMIEFPPKFAGLPPVNPDSKANKGLRQWNGAQGLADDVRYYGQWMRNEAEKRIGHLYPKIEITAEMAVERSDLKLLVGSKVTVIAWLWARTVKSPNPAFANVDVPLVSNFMISTKSGKEAYVEPVIENGDYRFEVKVGIPKNITLSKNGTVDRGGGKCLMSGTSMPFTYLRSEAKAGRFGTRLMAIVVEGQRGRIYLSPTNELEAVASGASPEWSPDVTICHWPGRTNVVEYGMTKFGDLFTKRQLLALTTFSNLVAEVHQHAVTASRLAGLSADAKSLSEDGNGALAYADALAVYLTFSVDKCADYWSTICSWINSIGAMRNTFARQAIPMVWDFAEVNVFSDSTGNWMAMVDWTWKALETMPARVGGEAQQADAQSQTYSNGKVISTDPPYYDNIEYADLSDFFYVWMRRSLRQILPNLFLTVAVPKVEELVANPHRHNGKRQAEAFFLNGMTDAMHRLADQAHPAFPTSIYYAFKQSENDAVDGSASTGWETFLDAVIQAGLALTGTWPMRTEFANRPISDGTNALASSIILVCRPRSTSAATATRREFLSALKAELPAALAHLQRGNIAPVDLAQASIGPGMAVYTRYAKVVDAEGKTLTVREALALINQTLDEVLSEQEGDFDADSRWAVAWFDQMGFAEGEFGTADTLARAKVTSVAGLVEAGILISKAGKVHLLKPDQLPEDWDPLTDKRLTVWEMVHHLIRVLEAQGENAAALLVAKLGVKAEVARELAYRLYTVCERKKRATEALSYNALVQSWPEISRLSRAQTEAVVPPLAEPDLFESN